MGRISSPPRTRGMSTRQNRHSLTLLILAVVAPSSLAGCTSDAEKALVHEEKLAAIVEANKGDCDRMGDELAKYIDANAKEMKKLQKRLKPKGAAAKAEQGADKFAARNKAVADKMRDGFACFLTDKVAKAMMVLQDEGEDQPDRKPPPTPFTGAPVAFVVDKLGDKSLDVSVYNFGAKTTANYSMLIRYYGADGAPIKVGEGPFARDYSHMSIAGASYRVPSKQWRSFNVDFETPKGGVKAEVLVDSVKALAADGVRIEQEPLWKLDTFGWPLARADKK